MKITFRIVIAIISLGVIAAAVFVPIFNINVAALGITLEEDFSIYELIKLAIPEGSNSEAAFNLAEFWQNVKESKDVIKPLIAPVITFVVSFILALLLALATLVTNLIKPMKKTTMFLGLAGILSIVAAFISVNAVEKILVAGEINVFSIFDLGFLFSLATSFVEIKTFGLGSGVNLMLFAFIFIFIWGLSHILIELGDPKAQKISPVKERKRI